MAILLREAAAATEKGFSELLNELLPSAAGAAVFRLGTDPFFELSLPEVDARNPPLAVDDENDLAAEAAGLDDEETVSGEADAAGDAPGADVGTGAPFADDGTGAPFADDGTGASGADDGTGAGADTAAQATAEAEAPADPQPQFWANSRPEAIALMEKVVAFYRTAEPSSPVPLLLDRAMAMSSRSFMDLLRDVLPEGTLREVDRNEGY